MIYRIFIINLLDVVFILYIYCVNLENWNYGDDCVMLMLCLSLIHIYTVSSSALKFVIDTVRSLKFMAK